ncbi:hypothetical protein J5X94_03675, partial [Psychrobacter sp. K31L]|nr:hypothetical protein [Psychrobacter sp. K31L]
MRQASDTAPITVGTASNGTSVNFTNVSGVNRTLTGVAAGANTTDAVNVGQLTAASAAATAAKTVVAAGTNITGVTKTTNATTNQDTYTINAKGASTTAGSGAVTTASTTDNTTNVTTTAIDLSAASKASL